MCILYSSLLGMNADLIFCRRFLGRETYPSDIPQAGGFDSLRVCSASL